ncbi:MAG: hypothetical protein RLW62_21310 [Gammaproteobacteria bacterium]
MTRTLGRLHRKRGNGWLAATLVVLALGGCADTRYAAHHARADATLDGALSVAVVPLENLTNYPKAGLIAAELVTTELYRRELFRLTEGTALRQALNAQELDVADLAVTYAAAELGRRLGVAAVLVGSVSEYGYQHGLHEEPVVGLNLRLVDSTAGAILWAASHSTTGRGYLARDSVNACAQRLVEEMIAALASHVRAP